MNILTSPTPVVNTIAPVSIPFAYGAQDATAGDLCLPELFFTQRADWRDYALGHQSIAGKTLLSCNILGNYDSSCPKPPAPLDDDFEGAIEDDHLWIIRGC